LKASTIAFFAVFLFIFQITAGVLVTLALGTEEFIRWLAVQYIADTIVSACVFAYMTWIYSTKPYVMAISVGFLAALLGALSSALLTGNFSWWHPASLVLDIPALLVAVLLGVGLGAKYKHRNSTNV